MWACFAAAIPLPDCIVFTLLIEIILKMETNSGAEMFDEERLILVFWGGACMHVTDSYSFCAKPRDALGEGCLRICVHLVNVC